MQYFPDQQIPDLLQLPCRLFKGWAIDHHLRPVTTPNGQKTTERTPLADAMYRYRYGGATEVLPQITAAFQHAVSAMPPSTGRGFNSLLVVPAAVNRPEYRRVVEFSAALSKATGIPSSQHWVERVAHRSARPDPGAPATKASVALTSEKARNALAGSRILVVDDIYRSGRTVAELAALLTRDAGAADVCVLVGTWVGASSR